MTRPPDPQLDQAGDQPAGRAGGGDSRASGQDGRYGRAACGGDCDLCQCVVEPACPQRGDGCGATQPDFRRQWLGRTSNRAQLWPAQGIFTPATPVTISPLGSTAPTSLWWLPDQGQQRPSRSAISVMPTLSTTPRPARAFGAAFPKASMIVMSHSAPDTAPQSLIRPAWPTSCAEPWLTTSPPICHRAISM